MFCEPVRAGQVLFFFVFDSFSLSKALRVFPLGVFIYYVFQQHLWVLFPLQFASFTSVICTIKSITTNNCNKYYYFSPRELDCNTKIADHNMSSFCRAISWKMCSHVS